jgi:hypothetical protein
LHTVTTLAQKSFEQANLTMNIPTKTLGHYQNNCKPPKNKSKLNIPELHSEIKSLKQEIQEIKNSNFQITEEQLAQEMVTLKMNNNHSENSSIENEVEPEENCKQIVQLISQPTSKETPVCYRCGKTGHFQKNCKVKKEINKIDISKYNTEQLKDKFLQILQTDSENDSNNSLDDNASDNEIFQIENSSDSSFSENSKAKSHPMIQERLYLV